MRSHNRTWPHVTNALVRRFVADEVLLEAHNKVPLAKQSDREDEAMLFVRITKAARLCYPVFSNDPLIN